MLELSDTVIGSWLGAMLWPFVRIGGFLMVAPITSSRLVPVRIRLMLALVLTLVVAPNLPPVPQLEGLSLATFVLIAQQLFIGIAMGLVLQVMMQLFVLAGHIIGLQMALGFSQMVDPASGVSVPALSQFHLMLATMLFIAMNGHLAMIEVFVQGFYIFPIGAGFISSNAIWELSGWFSWMFASALLMALPAITAMMIINFALGIITKAAPQLNIFAIGFPFMLIVGLILVWIMIAGYIPLFDKFVSESLMMMTQLITR